MQCRPGRYEEELLATCFGGRGSPRSTLPSTSAVQHRAHDRRTFPRTLFDGSQLHRDLNRSGELRHLGPEGIRGRAAPGLRCDPALQSEANRGQSKQAEAHQVVESSSHVRTSCKESSYRQTAKEWSSFEDTHPTLPGGARGVRGASERRTRTLSGGRAAGRAPRPRPSRHSP